MNTCNDCGKNCRNSCARGGHGYCSDCSRASGYSTCSDCRSRQSTARRQSRRVQRSRASMAPAPSATQVSQSQPAAYLPPSHLAHYVGASGTPPLSQLAPSQPAASAASPSRKALTEMSEAEMEAWLSRVADGLADAQKRGRAYLDRRAMRGWPTSTDLSMERDQLIYLELLASIDEIRSLWHMADVAMQQIDDSLSPMSSYPDKIY